MAPLHVINKLELAQRHVGVDLFVLGKGLVPFELALPICFVLRSCYIYYIFKLIKIKYYLKTFNQIPRRHRQPTLSETRRAAQANGDDGAAGTDVQPPCH